MTAPHKKKIDIGLIWAKYINTWGQAGAVAGTANLIMMLGVFYTTTLRPVLAVPLWLYLSVVVVVATTGILFVLKIGISGYYRFFNKQSEMAATHREVQENTRRLLLIMEHLQIADTGIEDTGKEQ